MQYRSWLFVRGDRAADLGESVSTGADAIVVDLVGLPDAYAATQARANAAQWLTAHRKRIVEHKAAGRWVRINAMSSRQWRDDLLAVMPAAPDGIVLPVSAGPEDVRQLAAELYELEQRHHIAPGATRILPVVGETPHAALTISAYLESPHLRLAGFAWNSENLVRAIGATRRRIGKTARWADPLGHVRAQTLLAANACGVMAFDSSQDDLTDDKLWLAACRESRGDGFSGMFVRSLDRVAAVNQAFAPREEEIDRARKIVTAFETEPDAGSVEIDRRLISRDQLRRARGILGLDAAPTSPGIHAPILRPA